MRQFLRPGYDIYLLRQTSSALCAAFQSQGCLYTIPSAHSTGMESWRVLTRRAVACRRCSIGCRALPSLCLWHDKGDAI